MKRLVLVAAVAALATPAFAASNPAAPVNDLDKKVCKTKGESASRVRAQKVCMTKREWNDLATRTQQEHNEALNVKPGAQSGTR